MNNVIVNEEQIKEAGAKAISRGLYGTWFADKATPQELILRCESQIADCKKWIVNLEVMKAENETKVKAERLEAFKESITTMSAEERDYILSLINNQN